MKLFLPPCIVCKLIRWHTLPTRCLSGGGSRHVDASRARLLLLVGSFNALPCPVHYTPTHHQQPFSMQ